MVLVIDAAIVETMSLEPNKFKILHHAIYCHVSNCLMIHMPEPLMSYVNVLLCINYTLSNKYTSNAN